MSKSRSVSKEWDFATVSKGTEISLGKFVLEYFTPLTLEVQTGVVSDEDTTEIWEETKKEEMEKVMGNRMGNKNRSARTESPMTDEKEVILTRYEKGGGEQTHSHTNGSQLVCVCERER
jgi:hypothetical protein